MEKEINIMIAEDNFSDAELILRALKKKNIYDNIHIVSDGAEAVDFLFSQGKYSGKNTLADLKVILLDLKLPKLTGLEVLKIVKNDERTKRIPVVILTSSKEIKDIEDAYKYGANSYIVKPVEFDKFINEISDVGLYWKFLNQVS